MKQSGKNGLPRRRFLQQLMVLGGATGAGVVALQTSRAEMIDASANHPPVNPTTPSRGYHLTDHIRSYYEKAQI